MLLTLFITTSLCPLLSITKNPNIPIEKIDINVVMINLLNPGDKNLVVQYTIIKPTANNINERKRTSYKNMDCMEMISGWDNNNQDFTYGTLEILSEKRSSLPPTKSSPLPSP